MFWASSLIFLFRWVNTSLLNHESQSSLREKEEEHAHGTVIKSQGTDEAEPNIHENEAGDGLTSPAPKSHLTSLLSLILEGKERSDARRTDL